MIVKLNNLPTPTLNWARGTTLLAGSQLILNSDESRLLVSGYKSNEPRLLKVDTSNGDIVAQKNFSMGLSLESLELSTPYVLTFILDGNGYIVFDENDLSQIAGSGFNELISNGVFWNHTHIAIVTRSYSVFLFDYGT